MTINTLILIDREKIQFSAGGKILTFPMAQSLLKDLEIVDRNIFLNELGTFIHKNEISFGATLILLSESVCFIDESGNLQDFLATLPFENPVAISLNGKSIGTNKDLYEAVVELVGKYGGGVKGVAPIFLSKETFSARSLEAGALKFVLDNEEVFTKTYFSFTIVAPISTLAPSKTKVTPLSVWLGVIFIVLVAIFVVLLMVRG